MKTTAEPRDTLAPTILALLPSSGLGGGIERYCEGLLEALESAGACVVRLALIGSGERVTLLRKTRFVIRCIVTVRKLRPKAKLALLACHPGLAVAGLVVAWSARMDVRRLSVLFYGADIWKLDAGTAHLLRHFRVPLLTVSSFSAGLLAKVGPARIVRPGVRREWFEQLVSVGAERERDGSEVLHVVTVFRLEDAVAKGLPELIQAVERVRKVKPCRLSVAGSGRLPSEAAELVAARPWISLAHGLSDRALATLYHDADVFVLATRTRSTVPTSVEGFGIVLAEAQLAGLPVVAPAHGGSDDAFLLGITGLQPVDESAASLAAVLERLACDRSLRKQLGHNASAWAMATFDPARRQSDVAGILVQMTDPSAETAQTSPQPYSLTVSLTSADFGPD